MPTNTMLSETTKRTETPTSKPRRTLRRERFPESKWKLREPPLEPQDSSPVGVLLQLELLQEVVLMVLKPRGTQSLEKSLTLPISVLRIFLTDNHSTQRLRSSFNSEVSASHVPKDAVVDAPKVMLTEKVNAPFLVT